jgi:hypothetical protein
VLPESVPEIRLDAEGVCSVCRDHERRRDRSREEPFLETDFVKILRKYRGKGDYDCLVMCSGGKDSTASLYFMKRRYHMNPLAFTFDLGFETEEAMANVRNAVDALGVDLVVHRSSRLEGLFRRILETGAKVVLCHVCSIAYMQLTFETARRYRTPLIIAGWTKGQSVREEPGASERYGRDAPEYAAMARATREFVATLRGDPEYGDFPASMEEAVRRAGKRFRCVVQSPHWYLPDATEDHVEVLERELGWKPPSRSYPKGSTNCSLNFLASALSLAHYGYTHYHVEMSKLIRQGMLSREEALARLEPDFDESHLGEIAARCGARGDFAEIVARCG